MECPECSYSSPDPLLRCPGCGNLYDTHQLEELHHLKYLRERLEHWRKTGVLPTQPLVGIFQVIHRDILDLEERLGLAKPKPAPSVPAAVAAAAQPVPAQVARPIEPPIPERPVRPPREPFSWAKVADALLSRRALQTFLYVGATLLILSTVILVVQLWTDMHWVVRQIILLVGMSGLFWTGYQVREKMQLRLSGGVLMDIGVLWLPLNVGALLFEFMDISGDKEIPGLGVPLGLPLVGWMIIAATSTPVYAYLAYRFRLILMTYGAVIGAGATVMTALAASGVPLEWQLMPLVALASGFVWIASALRRSQAADMEPHVFWVAQAAVPALLGTVIGWVAADDGSRGAVTATAWAAVVFYGLSFRYYRHVAFEYLVAIGLPVAGFLTLAMHLDQLPLEWYNLILVGVAAAYVAYGRYVRKTPLLLRTGKSVIPALGVGFDPLYIVGAAMTVAAVAWPLATVPSATVSLYALVIVYGTAARVFNDRYMAYLSVALLFAPFALTILWAEVGMHWRAMWFALLGAGLLTTAEMEAFRSGDNKTLLVRLVDFPAKVKSLFAGPLFVVGYAAAAVALVFGAVDLLSSDNNGAWVFEGADPAPWTYAIVAGVLALSAYLRRTSIFVHVAVWVVLAFALLLADRGFYAGWDLAPADFGLVLGIVAFGYLALAFALDRVEGHYSKPLYMVGYLLTVAAMFLTIEVKELNITMVGMSTAVYATSGYLVHRGGHPAFRWLVDRLFQQSWEMDKRIANGAFLSLATGLFPAVVLLAVSFADPSVAWYGLTAALIAVAYVGIAESLARSEPLYRYQWYAFGLALSVAGPLITLDDPTLRVASIAVVTALYGAIAVVTRRPQWVYPVAALLPLLMILGMDRADVGMNYYGVALVALTVGYGAVGLVWRPDSLEKLLNPQIGRIGSFVLPLFAVGTLVTIVGIGLAATESSELVVSALGSAAVFYLLATFALRQTIFIYPAAFLIAAAYSVGLTIPDFDAKYYGLAVLPGVAVSLAMGLILQGYPGQYRFGKWIVGWATPRRLDPRHLDVFSPMMPFLLVAYAGSIAAPVLSAGEGWIFFGGLTAAAVIYGYSSWRFLSPLWSYAALLLAHGAFLRVLFLLSPDMPVSQVGAYWIPLVFLLAGIAGWAIKVRGTAISGALKQKDMTGLVGDWALPFIVFAGIGLVLSTVLASFEASTGLVAGLVYALPLAVGASLVRQQALAWASLGFLALAFAQGLRLAGVDLIDVPVYVAIAAGVLVVVTYLIQRIGEMGASSLRIWEQPVRVLSFVVIAAAPALGLAFWLAESAVADDLQPLVFTLAITGLALVGVAYLERKTWLTYAAVAVLEACYMTQLAVFEVGQAQLFVVPAAIFLIAVAYLERVRWNQGAVRALESAGLGLLLVVTLLQSMGLFTDGVNHQVYSIVLFFETLGVVIWGLSVQWKRPFFGGIAAFGANLIVLLFDPLGEGPVSSTILWSVFGAVGTGLVAGAVYLERNREKSSAAFRRMIDRLEAWS